MQYLGIDWGTRRAAWCAVDERGELVEGTVPADQDGLARLVHTLGPDVRGCVEMMRRAVWVRERLRACGWEFQIADARKLKAIAPLACKTDRVDARVLAQLVQRDLAPEVWVPSLSDRELRERLRRRAHLVRLNTSARNRMFGLLTQRACAGTCARVARAVRNAGCRQCGSSRCVLLGVVDDLERQLAAIDTELRPTARTDQPVELLSTIPGIGELLGLTIAAEIGEVVRFHSARK
jgi:transposase